MKKILYGISGIGNGHANREMPIIEELVKDCKVMIFCHDDSLRVMTNKFGSHPNVTIVPVGLTFIVGSETGLNFDATAKAAQNQNIESFKTSFEALNEVITKWGKADLVITDYEPTCAQYAYAYNVPLITVDQQSKFLYGDLPEELGGFTFKDEVARLSMFFPKVDQRIACSFFKVKPREDSRDVMLVPPTIKQSIIDLKDRRKLDEEKVNILVYISSAKEFPQTPKEIIEQFAKQNNVTFHLFVPKIDFEKYDALKVENTLIYAHGDQRFIEIMGKANGIVSTAGHSLLSEAMYLSIPVYTIPIQPYEQHLNAWAIATNNFGVSETKITEEKLSEFVANLKNYTENIRNDKEILLRGVGQDIILDYLRKNYLRDKKKIMVFSPPFSGHLNILKEFINDNKNDFDFSLIITGWKNIKPDLSRTEHVKVKILEESELKETDPAMWTFPRVNELLGKCITEVKEFKPDLIIYDFFSLEGNLAGKILNVPYWCSVPAMIGPFEHQDYRDEKFNNEINQKALAEIEKSWGVVVSKDEVEMVSDGFHLPGVVNLVWSFPQITPSDYKKNRSNVPYVFVGNPRGDNHEKTNFKNPKPLIYFSLGTVIMDNLWNQQEETREKLKKFFGKLAELWKDKDYQIVFVTQGKKVLDKYPDNWWVYDSVDQVEILSRADIFITHGGSNSFHEAVMQKVPMVVIPFFGDQLLVAKRTEELGLGIRAGGSESIDTHDSKDFINDELASSLVESVDEMLESSSYSSNYLFLSLDAYSIKSLISGEVDADTGDLVVDKDIEMPNLKGKIKENIDKCLDFYLANSEGTVRDEKLIDFFSTIFKVHILLKENEKLSNLAKYVFEDEAYFRNGVVFYKYTHDTWIPLNFEEVKQRYDVNDLKQRLRKIDYRKALVTSESKIKIDATKESLGLECEVNGFNPNLPHDEQLIGLDEIARATTERLIATKESISDVDLYVSTVSGIRKKLNQYEDVAVVLVLDKDGKRAISRSAGLPLPSSSTQKAMLRGLKNFTVGKILGEEMASHKYDTDPHFLITQGKQSRKELLTQAISLALKHLKIKLE